MPQIEEIGSYLKGIWLLLTGKPEGFAFLDITAVGFWRSFAAMLWCLPAMAVSWSAWRLYYLSNMPTGTLAGPSFIFKLALVDLASWMVPLLLIALLARPLGYGRQLAPIVIATNWLSVPIFYALSVPAALRLTVPGSDGLTSLLSLILLVLAFTAVFRLFKAIISEHTLLATTLSALYILPSLMVGEALQRFFQLLPA